MTVTATPTGLTLSSRLISVKASCLYLYPDPVVAQPVVPVVWPRVSAQLAAAAPAAAVVAVRVVAAAVAAAPACAVAAVIAVAVACAAEAAVAEPPEAVPVLPASPV